MIPCFENCAVFLCLFSERIVAETDQKLCLQRKFKTDPQKCVDHIWGLIYAERQTNYCRKSYKNRLKTSVLRRFLVRVGRLELPASCSQMCVGTFSRHFTALFGPFLCLGSSSLKLFCPACFKKPFRLLGFVWDWILCIKRCSAQFEGQWQSKLPQRNGAGIAPHKQRIKPFPPVVWAQPISTQINDCLPKVISFYHAAAPKTTGAYTWR